MKFTAAFVGLVAMVTLATAAPVAEPAVKPDCGFAGAIRPCPWKKEALPEPIPAPVAEPTVAPQCGFAGAIRPCPWKKDE